MIAPILVRTGALVCASLIAQSDTLPTRVEPDPRTIPQLSPEQKKQREDDTEKHLRDNGLAFSLVGIGSIAPDQGALGQGGRIGGLSGLAHLEGNRFLVVSDSQKQPAVYELRIALSPTDNPDRFALEPTLTAAPMELVHASTDGESIALLPESKGVVIGYERPPVVALMRPAGASGGGGGAWQFEKLPIPASITDEIRTNRAFESVMVRTRDSATEIWASTEAALTSDGPEATTQAGTRCRVLVFSGGASGKRPWELDRQYTYTTEKCPDGALNVAFNSLSEFCPLGDGRWLSLERSFTPLGGFNERLFLLDGSTRAPQKNGGLPELIKAPAASIRDLGVAAPANLEGMALGPRMSELTGDKDQKGRLLLLVADDDFGSSGQVGSQIVALRVIGLDLQDREGQKTSE